MNTALDLDAVRVMRAANKLVTSGKDPDKPAMDAASRLADNQPDHPALKFLTRLMNQRDGF